MTDQKGIYRKFEVRRTDGRDQSGEKHHGCRYFVLDLDHDPNAVAALKAYSLACQQEKPRLSDDLGICLVANHKGLMAPLFEKIMLDAEKKP